MKVSTSVFTISPPIMRLLGVLFENCSEFEAAKRVLAHEGLTYLFHGRSVSSKNGLGLDHGFPDQGFDSHFTRVPNRAATKGNEFQSVVPHRIDVSLRSEIGVRTANLTGESSGGNSQAIPAGLDWIDAWEVVVEYRFTHTITNTQILPHS